MSKDDNLRAVQMIELEMLLELDRICKKRDIKYFLLSGTVLGAVRHKGFIPWDDDIDVGMMRSEYQRFIKVCPKELDNKYFLQTYKTDLQYPNLFAKIRKNNTTFIEKENEKIDMHKGVFIDIFPFDNIPDGKLARCVHKYLLLLLVAIRVSRTPYIGSKKVIRKLMTFMHPITKMIPKCLLDRYENGIAKMYNGNGTQYVGNIFGLSIYEYSTRIMINRDYFFPLCKLEFEGYYFPAPGRWHEYLTHYFNDYMILPPEDKRLGHNVIYVNLNKGSR